MLSQSEHDQPLVGTCISSVTHQTLVLFWISLEREPDFMFHGHQPKESERDKNFKKYRSFK